MGKTTEGGADAFDDSTKNNFFSLFKKLHTIDSSQSRRKRRAVENEILDVDSLTGDEVRTQSKFFIPSRMLLWRFPFYVCFSRVFFQWFRWLFYFRTVHSSKEVFYLLFFFFQPTVHAIFGFEFIYNCGLVHAIFSMFLTSLNSYFCWSNSNFHHTFRFSL